MSACKQCGADVTWRSEDGRWQCFNPDGSIHWDACSKRRWQQVVATGKRFEGMAFDGMSANGYRKPVHGTKFDRLTAKAVRGENYKPTGLCRQCVPPWEDCPGCPDAFKAAA